MHNKFKKICLLLTACMSISFACGCTDPTPPSSPVKMGANEIYNQILRDTSMPLPPMITYNDDYIRHYWGVDLSDFTSFVFAETTEPSCASIIVIAKLKPDADVTNLKHKLGGYVHDKMDLCQEKHPELVERYKDYEIIEKNGYLCLVVSDFKDTIDEIIDINSAKNYLE